MYFDDLVVVLVYVCFDLVWVGGDDFGIGFVGYFC